jgi:hypothetical protein
MKTRADWRYSSTFLNLGTRWRWVVNFTPLPLYPRGKSPRYPSVGGWVGPTVGLDAMEKWKILYCRESNPGRPTHSTSLYRLLNNACNLINYINSCNVCFKHSKIHLSFVEMLTFLLRVVCHLRLAIRICGPALVHGFADGKHWSAPLFSASAIVTLVSFGNCCLPETPPDFSSHMES